MKKLLIILCLLAIKVSAQTDRTTTIFLVRHAEKVTADPADKDPLLTEKGQKRALALAKKLKRIKLAAIYSTDFQRTKLTAHPTALKNDLFVKIYDPKNLKDLAKGILEIHKGKNVLIVGHSNTVLETIEALGGKRPITAINDQEYDYFFTVKVATDGAVSVNMEHYGKKNSNAEGEQKMH